MSKKMGDARQQLVTVQERPADEQKKEINAKLKELVIPLAKSNPRWVVGAKSSIDTRKESRQVTVQELENPESQFYDQLVHEELDQIIVAPPIAGG